MMVSVTVVVATALFTIGDVCHALPFFVMAQEVPVTFVALHETFTAVPCCTRMGTASMFKLGGTTVTTAFAVAVPQVTLYGVVVDGETDALPDVVIPDVGNPGMLVLVHESAPLEFQLSTDVLPNRMLAGFVESEALVQIFDTTLHTPLVVLHAYEQEPSYPVRHAPAAPPGFVCGSEQPFIVEAGHAIPRAMVSVVQAESAPCAFSARTLNVWVPVVVQVRLAVSVVPLGT